MIVNYDYWYGQAKIASADIGWLPETILAQWIVETAHFTSNNFVNNRNIAGQTWYKGCGHDKGTARQEGGFYIKYSDATSGYCDFVRRNINRYKKVATFKTVAEQVKAIKEAGWAADPNYVTTVMSVYRWCITHHIIEEPKAPSKYKSLVDYLKVHHMKSDFISRRQLAVKYRVVSDSKDYSGTAEQNNALLNKLDS